MGQGQMERDSDRQSDRRREMMEHEKILGEVGEDGHGQGSETMKCLLEDATGMLKAMAAKGSEGEEVFEAIENSMEEMKYGLLDSVGPHIQ